MRAHPRDAEEHRVEPILELNETVRFRLERLRGVAASLAPGDDPESPYLYNTTSRDAFESASRSSAYACCPPFCGVR